MRQCFRLAESAVLVSPVAADDPLFWLLNNPGIKYTTINNLDSLQGRVPPMPLHAVGPAARAIRNYSSTGNLLTDYSSDLSINSDFARSVSTESNISPPSPLLTAMRPGSQHSLLPRPISSILRSPSRQTLGSGFITQSRIPLPNSPQQHRQTPLFGPNE